MRPDDYELREALLDDVAALNRTWLWRLEMACRALIGPVSTDEAKQIVDAKDLRREVHMGDSMREQLWEGDQLRYEQWMKHDLENHTMTIHSRWVEEGSDDE